MRGAWRFAVARNKITDQQRKREPDLFADIFDEEEDEDEIDWKAILFDNGGNPETEYFTFTILGRTS
ncbi:MAG: hypothetical protein WKG06_23400 [Segetibacter sp.]